MERGDVDADIGCHLTRAQALEAVGGDARKRGRYEGPAPVWSGLDRLSASAGAGDLLGVHQSVV
jgi:hypothetical protein